MPISDMLKMHMDSKNKISRYYIKYYKYNQFKNEANEL